jgi:hypothetical protein
LLFDLITRYIIVSSAERLIVESSPVEMSLILYKNRVGHRTEPSGTPESTGRYVDFSLSTMAA